MSTFKQIVEGYAENLSNAAMRGAAPIKRMGKIDSNIEELQTKVRLANNAYDSGFYTEYNSGRHMDTNTRSIEAHKAGNASREAAVSDFSNSINELLNNPNLSTKHLVSIHALVDRIPDNSTLGDKKISYTVLFYHIIIVMTSLGVSITLEQVIMHLGKIFGMNKTPKDISFNIFDMFY